MPRINLPFSWLTGAEKPDSFEAQVQQNMDAIALALGALSGRFFIGTGTPEGVVTAPVGAIYTRRDGGAGTTLYVKESGTADTGWIAK